MWYNRSVRESLLKSNSFKLEIVTETNKLWKNYLEFLTPIKIGVFKRKLPLTKDEGNFWFLKRNVTTIMYYISSVKHFNPGKESVILRKI